MLILLSGVQFGGDEVVEAKGGAGSATLSMAYAGFRYSNRSTPPTPLPSFLCLFVADLGASALRRR